MDISCKKCRSTNCYKNGTIRDKQRYKCKECGYNFVEGDKRLKSNVAIKSLTIILYGTCKASYGMIARLFGVSRTAVMKWVREIGRSIPEPEFETDALEIEIDEMWHFLNKKKRNSGSGELLKKLETELSAGLSVNEMLQRSLSSMKSSNYPKRL